MPAVAVGNKFRVAFTTMCNSQLGLNIKLCEVTNIAGGGGDWQSLANSISDTYKVKFKNLMANEATYKGVQLVIYPNPSLYAPVTSNTGAGVGVAGAGPLPLQVSGVLTLRTAFMGRSGRGRLFMPFPAGADNIGAAEPTPTADYVTRLNSLGSSFLTDIVVADPDNPGVEYTLSWGLEHLGTLRPFTARVGRQKWGTQRRRGNYGRHNEAPF